MNSRPFLKERLGIIKSRRRLFIFTGLAVLCIMIGFLWWWFGQKSYGFIGESASKEVGNKKEEGVRLAYEGKYLTFTYPAGFTRHEENEAVKYPLLERGYFVQSGIEGQKIAVSVQENTGYSLEEYSSFRIRKMDPSLYRQESWEKEEKKATVFVKEKDGSEISLFMERKNQVIAIVLSSSLASRGLQEEAKNLFDSFTWNY